VRRFRWLPAGAIPEEFDLRRCGWRLVASAEGAGSPVPVLADIRRLDAGRWIELLGNVRLASRQRIVMLGVSEPPERARLLRLGFGEVLGAGVQLTELEARVELVRASSDCLPRYRRCGRLLLDLFARDGFVAGRRLGLHPREFEVLWYLAEIPGVPVSRARLIADVWLLAHPPETNSVAVHVYRLRRKLAIAGLRDWIGTTRDGGAYYLTDWRDTPALTGRGSATVRSLLDERRVSSELGRGLAGRTIDE
jgi:two-component system, OmpR family, response regulator